MSTYPSTDRSKFSERVSTNPWRFLFCVLMLSWFFWILASEVIEFSVFFLYLGGAIPFVMTLVFLFHQNTAAERYDFLVRVVNFKRISGRLWLIILLIVPTGFFISGCLNWMLFGMAPILDPLINISEKPFGLLLFAFFILIFGPVPEEISWRGFVLDKLQILTECSANRSLNFMHHREYQFQNHKSWRASRSSGSVRMESA